MKKVTKKKVFKTPIKKVAKKATKKASKKIAKKKSKSTDSEEREVIVSVRYSNYLFPRKTDTRKIVSVMENKISKIYGIDKSIDIQEIKILKTGDVEYFVYGMMYDGELDQVEIDLREFLWDFENYPQNGENYRTGKRPPIPDQDYIDIRKIYESMGKDTSTFRERFIFFVDAFKYLFLK